MTRIVPTTDNALYGRRVFGEVSSWIYYYYYLKVVQSIIQSIILDTSQAEWVKHLRIFTVTVQYTQ